MIVAVEVPVGPVVIVVSTTEPYGSVEPPNDVGIGGRLFASLAMIVIVALIFGLLHAVLCDAGLTDIVKLATGPGGIGVGVRVGVGGGVGVAVGGTGVFV